MSRCTTRRTQSMDDIDSVVTDVSGESGVEHLSTDQLREEVARLQSLLVVGQGGEASADDDDELDDEEELPHLDESRAFGWVDDTTLKYTNGDLYKVSDI